MADVFLSYKREDAPRVRKLVAALESAGLDAWWDEDIPGGVQWEAAIEKALGEARAVIVCWSPESVASENVRSEARVAREDGRLIQVFMKPCTPPLFFGERQGFDLSGWRGNARDSRITRLVTAVKRVAEGERPQGTDRREPVRRWFEYRVHVAVAALLLIAGSIAGWWLLAPAGAEGAQTLAVLPFRALNASDQNLVDAIWDDTRGAISRNPNLKVLGRQAVEALAKQDLAPADYRRKVGADYLLDGSVEHVGDEVRMKLSLTRTSDSAEVWSDEIGGKLDDVFTFQQRVANEVEGRIRGRVAPGAGTKPKNIATTGAVYAVYAEGHALVKKRDPDSERQAVVLLKKALAADPNYAPAWAELGVASHFTPRIANDPEEHAQEPIHYLKRALQLAPNLAYAHAALSMVENFPPESEPDLRRAIALDPGSVEAWMWLGGMFQAQNKMNQAFVAYSRAVEIEPFWRPAVLNKIQAAIDLGRMDAANAEVERVSRLGDPLLVEELRIAVVVDRGDSGDALRMLLEFRVRHPELAGWVDQRTPTFLQRLGFIDEAQTLLNNGPVVIKDYKGIPEPPSSLWAGWKTPAQFWKNDDAPALFARMLPKHGRLDEYVSHYRAAFPTADDFIAARAFSPETLVQIAPTLAVVLRAGGEPQGDEILRRTEPILRTWLRNGPADRNLLAQLAFFRAAEGFDDDAVSFLARADAKGWLPDNQYFATDIADEPCFARLLNRSDFQAIRGRILARVAAERRKVPLDLLAKAYPQAVKAVA